ncbi:MAG: antitoxin [bacterium]
MEITKSYIVDDEGNIKAVVMDFDLYKKIEDLLLDFGLAKAMEEIADDQEIDLEDAKRIADFKNAG